MHCDAVIYYSLKVAEAVCSEQTGSEIVGLVDEIAKRYAYKSANDSDEDACKIKFVCDAHFVFAYKRIHFTLVHFCLSFMFHAIVAVIKYARHCKYKLIISGRMLLKLPPMQSSFTKAKVAGATGIR